jgi:hypothetical protein
MLVRIVATLTKLAERFDLYQYRVRECRSSTRPPSLGLGASWRGWHSEHYFFNGTTAYWLMRSRNEQVIQSSIERLHQLKLNRMRVTVAGRTNV